MPKPQKAAQSVVSVKALGKEARVGVKRDKDVFKVPRVPSRAGLGRSTSEADVFGSLKGGPLEAVVGNAEIERENKNVSEEKTSVVSCVPVADKIDRL